MKIRHLGKTGIKVSELSYGAGGFWGMKVFDEKQAHRLVDIALDKGITLFDTGPNYSQANAEPRLGRILKGRFNSVNVGTKVGTRYINGRHVKDFSPKAIEDSVRRSLINLQTDHIPLLQLHGMPEVLEDETIETLLRLKEKGIIGHFGVSTDGDDAIRAVNSGIFETLMIDYNIIQRIEPSQIITKASEKGMGVLIKSPLAQTLFSNSIWKVKKISDVWYLLRALKNYRGKLMEGRKYRFINDIKGWTGVEVALNYVLNNENVSSAVIGTVTEKHLYSNIDSTIKMLPKEIIHDIEAIICNDGGRS